MCAVGRVRLNATAIRLPVSSAAANCSASSTSRRLDKLVYIFATAKKNAMLSRLVGIREPHVLRACVTDL